MADEVEVTDEADISVEGDETTATDVDDVTGKDTSGAGGGDDDTDSDDDAEVKPIIDWKAMSRKWEKRAKENAKRAEDNDAAKRKLDEATVTTQTELDKLRESIESLKSENETNKLKALRADISQSTGVPVELLTASSEDELQDQAEAIKAFVAANAPKPPVKTAATAKPKEKLRSGAAGAKPEMSREDILAAVTGRTRRRGAK